MFTLQPYSRIAWLKETHPNGVYIPKRSQKLKSKRLRANNKKGKNGK